MEGSSRMMRWLYGGRGADSVQYLYLRGRRGSELVPLARRRQYKGSSTMFSDGLVVPQHSEIVVQRKARVEYKVRTAIVVCLHASCYIAHGGGCALPVVANLPSLLPRTAAPTSIPDSDSLGEQTKQGGSVLLIRRELHCPDLPLTAVFVAYNVTVFSLELYPRVIFRKCIIHRRDGMMHMGPFRRRISPQESFFRSIPLAQKDNSIFLLPAPNKCWQPKS